MSIRRVGHFGNTSRYQLPVLYSRKLERVGRHSFRGGIMATKSRYSHYGMKEKLKHFKHKIYKRFEWVRLVDTTENALLILRLLMRRRSRFEQTPKPSPSFKARKLSDWTICINEAPGDPWKLWIAAVGSRVAQKFMEVLYYVLIYLFIAIASLICTFISFCILRFFRF